MGSAERSSALFHFSAQLKVVVAPGFNGRRGLSGFLAAFWCENERPRCQMLRSWAKEQEKVFDCLLIESMRGVYLLCTSMIHVHVPS